MQSLNLRAFLSLTVCIILVIYLYFFYSVARSFEAEAFADFESEASATSSEISLILNNAKDSLHNVIAMFASSSHVNEKVLQKFVEKSQFFQRNQNIRAIAIGPLLESDQLEIYNIALKSNSATRQALGYPEFKPVTLQSRDVAIPLALVESPGGRDGIVGFDMASSEARLKTARQSFNSGSIVMTPPVKLSQDSSDAYSSVLLVGSSKDAKIEYLAKLQTDFEPILIFAASFTPGAAIDRIISDKGSRLFEVNIVDVSNEKITIFQSRASNGDDPLRTDNLQFAGREWSIQYYPSDQISSAIPPWLLALFSSGLLLIVGLAWSINALIKIRESLKEQVAEQTQDLESAKRAAEEARERVEEAQRIAKVGSWHLDVKTNQVTWTEELYYMLGFDPELPVPPYEEYLNLFAPKSRDLLLSSQANTVKTGIPYEFELQTDFKDGSRGWMWVRGERLDDENGITIGLQGVAMDITERKRAEESLRQAGEILKTMQTGLYVYELENPADDSSLRMVIANEASGTLSGVSPEDLIGKCIDEIFPALRVLGIPKRFADIVRTGKTSEFEDFYYADDRVLEAAYAVKAFPLPNHRVGITFDNITERKMVEEALRASEDKFRSIFASMTEIVVLHELVCDEDGRPENYRILDCNPAFTQITGIRRDDAVGRLATDVYGSDTAPYLDEYARVALTGEPCTFIATYAPMDKHFDVHAASPGTNRFVAVTTDITERKQAEEALRLAVNVFTHAREGIVITDRDANILDVNAAFTYITGYSREEVLGKNPHILSSGKQDKAFYAAMWHALLTKGHWYGEVWNRRKDGGVIAEMMTISAVHDERGEVQNFIALFSDITTIKEHQAQLEYIAHYDALTGLPNRLLLDDRLRQAMSQAPRRGQHLAVAYLDLDGFKAVNDTHGHEVGDRLLATLAKRMTQVLRDGDTLGRLGGDEFVAVLVDLSDAEASVPILTRLLEAAAQPFPVGDIVLNVSASLGVTFYPQREAVDADHLLRQADQAMYQAKQAGKNRYHAFDAEQDRNVRGHHESLEHIRHALAERQFVLFYQPKVNMRTGEVIGAEALIRWQHPQRGLLPPAVFLPVIENHPLAIDLGEWVIDTALAQIEAWRANGLPIPVSVNVGALQLQHPDFVPCLRTLLARHPGVNPGELELEILETSALESYSGVSQVMASCQALGVGFALDDFGTGYSSLTHLKQLPAGLLKIDQSFVRDMLDDPDDLAILESVLGLATAFRRQVIAEGVETLAHGEMLLRLGCEWAQGYAIARPMLANEFQGWASAWDAPPSWKALNPISKDRLSVLSAAVEHRAWILEMADYLSEKRDTPPERDAHQCRFGHWLDHGGRALLLGEGDDQLVDPLHREIHGLAAELMVLKRDGCLDELQTRISELHRLRDQLLEQLSELY